MRIAPYCAYGSNLNIEQMKARCPSAKIIGSGMLRDWKLVFKYHADIIPDNGSSVPVVLWNITEDDLASLDMYEGYPNYYNTVIVDVETDDGIVSAFVYVMNDKYNELEVPAASYFNTIADGYRDNELDMNYLYDAYNEVE